MSTLMACAVRDEALDAFNRPFFVNSLGMAIRSFEDEVNRKHEENAMRNHPKDFSLWHVGFYHEEEGKLEALDVPLRLCHAEGVLSKED